MSSPATILLVAKYLKWSPIFAFWETLDDVDGGHGGDGNADVDGGDFDDAGDGGDQ